MTIISLRMRFMTTRNTRTVDELETRGLSPKARPPKAWDTSKPPGGKLPKKPKGPDRSQQ